MLNYIEFLIKNMNFPSKLASLLVVIFLSLQIIGELLEAKGKIVPEVLKVRKFFYRKKREKEEIRKAIENATKAAENATLVADRVEKLLKCVDEKYDKDNISKRDKWMNKVDNGLVESECHWKESESHWNELKEKIIETFEIALETKVENMRNTILNFAGKIVDENRLVTHEEFRRIINTYEQYEKLIEEKELVNGQVDIAYRIIEEEYEKRLRSHAFIEDTRWSK